MIIVRAWAPGRGAWRQHPMTYCTAVEQAWAHGRRRQSMNTKEQGQRPEARGEALNWQSTTQQNARSGGHHRRVHIKTETNSKNDFQAMIHIKRELRQSISRICASCHTTLFNRSYAGILRPLPPSTHVCSPLYVSTTLPPGLPWKVNRAAFRIQHDRRIRRSCVDAVEPRPLAPARHGISSTGRASPC